MEIKLIDEIKLDDLKDFSPYKREFINQHMNEINESADFYTKTLYNFNSKVENCWWNNHIGMEVIVRSIDHTNLKLYLNTGLVEDGHLYFGEDNGDYYVKGKLLPFMHNYLFINAFEEEIKCLKTQYLDFVKQNNLYYIDASVDNVLLHNKMFDVHCFWEDDELYNQFMNYKEEDIDWSLVRSIYYDNLKNTKINIRLYANSQTSKEKLKQLIETLEKNIKDIELPISIRNITVQDANIVISSIYGNSTNILEEGKFNIN